MPDTPKGRRTSYEELQSRLVARLGHHGLSDLDHGTIVVVPSLSFPTSELRKIIGIQYYEERLLCLALQLRSPGLQMVFVTSMPVGDSVVDYYLSFLPDPADAHRRLHMISVGDPAQRGLSSKLLSDGGLLDEIAAIAGSTDSYIVPFNVTDDERTLAEFLDIPIYGTHPDLAYWGSKSGARQIAKRAGVAVPEGYEDLSSTSELEKALVALAESARGDGTAVIKLNNGFSGQGNAIVDLTKPVFPLRDSATVFCAFEESWDSYLAKVEAEGAIAEALIVGGATSPSVQLRVIPSGEVEIVSTHDQILGGLDDQVYLGCRFPARSDYRSAIQADALRVGELLAAEGVIGSFGIDFVVVKRDGDHSVFLSEINLRMGGTTHPYLMTRYATDGTYDASTGRLVAGGNSKFYVATDNLKSDAYVGMSADDVIAVVAERGLAYDDSVKKGATLHLLGALKDHGKLGTVCIAESRADAEELYERIVATLDDVAEDKAP